MRTLSINIVLTVLGQDFESGLGFIQVGSQLRPQRANCSFAGHVGCGFTTGQSSILQHFPASVFLTWPSKHRHASVCLVHFCVKREGDV